MFGYQLGPETGSVDLPLQDFPILNVLPLPDASDGEYAVVAPTDAGEPPATKLILESLLLELRLRNGEAGDCDEEWFEPEAKAQLWKTSAQASRSVECI